MAKTNRHSVLKKLNSKSSTLTFKKLSGEDRTINCTVNLQYIPEEHHPKSKQLEEHDAYIHVYDLDDGCWKTVYIDRIIP